MSTEPESASTWSLVWAVKLRGSPGTGEIRNSGRLRRVGRRPSSHRRERLAVSGDEPVTITLTATGAEGVVARFITDEGQVFLNPLPAGGPATVSWTTRPRLSSYVRAEIRRPQTNEMVALTNPIFLGR